MLHLSSDNNKARSPLAAAVEVSVVYKYVPTDVYTQIKLFQTLSI